MLISREELEDKVKGHIVDLFIINLDKTSTIDMIYLEKQLKAAIDRLRASNDELDSI